jgi:hypothetical protein
VGTSGRFGRAGFGQPIQREEPQGLQLPESLWEEAFAAPRAIQLAGSGANPQRPLWASTGVKDPSLPDAHYV